MLFGYAEGHLQLVAGFEGRWLGRRGLREQCQGNLIHILTL